MPTLYSKPSLQGQMIVSSDYNVLNEGFTDRVFLLGHADGLELNDPYGVVNVQDAINKLNGDTASPLLKGMLELYYGGARDIWLVAAAPMSEYVVNPPERNHAFYNTYATRLETTYDMLNSWDFPHIVVPLDAPFYDAKGVDFLTPLAQSCADIFEVSGLVRLGLLGTQTGAIHTSVSTIANDARLQTIGDLGKFVAVIVGEGISNIREMPVTYNCPLVTAVAAEMCQLPWNRSMVYHAMRNISSLTTPMTDDELSQLCEAKLNPVGNTSLGDRGRQFQSVLLTDNTLGTTGTDFWALYQMRFVQHLIEVIQTQGRRYMGTIGYSEFKRQIEDFLSTLKSDNFVRDFTLNISRDLNDQMTILVDVSVKLYFGIRQINFVTVVGPST